MTNENRSNNEHTTSDNPTADKMPGRDKPVQSPIADTRKQTTKGTWGDREATNGNGVAGGGNE